MSKKILVSPGYGAGWASWNTYPAGLGKFVAEYQPVIDYLEAGNSFERCRDNDDYIAKYDVLSQLTLDAHEKFKTDYVCLLGAYDLTVVNIPDGSRYRIDEYDGSESYLLQDSEDWW
jgi:hypothetical protein